MTKEYKHWHCEKDNENIYWARLDKAGASTNSVNHEVLHELSDIVDEVAQGTCQGLVITSNKPKGFIAGADLHYVSQFSAAEDIDAFVKLGQDVYAKLESLSLPTVALINGFCMGGGLEMALACDYRIALEDEGTKLGLPEVNIGIHPGWGGCVRLPKLIGALKAFDVILTGRPIRASAAKRMGFVDEVVPLRQLERAARFYVTHKPAKHSASFFERLTNKPFARKLLAKIFMKKTRAKISPKQYPSPFAAIHCWEHYGIGHKAYEQERRSMVKMAITDTARNLIRVFFLQDKLKELAKVRNIDVKHVHVIGAGVMGGDIAAWCALKGITVTLQDREDKFIAPAIKRAHALYKKKLKKPRLITNALDRLIPDVAGDGIAKADVIIEAIVENLEAKQGLFKQLEQQAKTDAILATNTSSIPLDEISEVLEDRSRLVGIHFFNPVAKMPLVEVVYSRATDQDVKERAQAFVGVVGKLALPVTSSPGFLVNRILMPYLLEAVTLLDEGFSAQAIDKAALKFGMPMGPIELADTVGLDICLSVATNLTSHFGGTVPEVLKRKVAQGDLGRKTGTGYYTYKNGKKVKDKQTESSRNLTTIQDRLILRLVNEGVSCLREGVVENAELLDAGMIFGTGFAPFRGGPIHYAKKRGILHVVEELNKLQEQYGGRFAADAAWEQLEAS